MRPFLLAEVAMPNLHLTDLEALTIRTSLDRLELIAERPPADEETLRDRITSAVALIRDLLAHAEQRGPLH
jgi:hypothetical protein